MPKPEVDRARQHLQNAGLALWSVAFMAALGGLAAYVARTSLVVQMFLVVVAFVMALSSIAAIFHGRRAIAHGTPTSRAAVGWLMLLVSTAATAAMIWVVHNSLVDTKNSLDREVELHRE